MGQIRLKIKVRKIKIRMYFNPVLFFLNGAAVFMNYPVRPCAGMLLNESEASVLDCFVYIYKMLSIYLTDIYAYPFFLDYRAL